MSQNFEKGVWMSERPRVLITLREGGENGGPYVSHVRIMESRLQEQYEFIPLMVPKPRELMRPAGMARFVRTIKCAKPDFVHYAGLQLEGFLVSCALKLAGVKRSVLAIHGSTQEAVYFPRRKKVIVGLLEAITLRYATICYGVSDYVVGWRRVRRNARHCFGRISNLPHPEEVNSEPSAVRRKLGLSDNEIVLVSAGRVTRDKGFDILLESLKLLAPLPFSALIVGEGDYLSEMKQGADVYGLGERVMFLGYRTDVPQILQASDIFVLLSLHETFGNAIIEAAQESLPVVATRVGGIPEIVNDGYTGILVPPGNATDAADAIGKLIVDAKLRRKMGLNASSTIHKRFAKSDIVDRLDALYSGILSGKWD